jgi:hypothetical protein
MFPDNQTHVAPEKTTGEAWYMQEEQKPKVSFFKRLLNLFKKNEKSS